jgi:hypothetical protein
MVMTEPKRRNWAHGYVRPVFVNDFRSVPESARSVMVCGPRPTPDEAAQMVADGWSVHDESRWPVLRREGQVIRWAGSWFGAVDVDTASTSWAEMERWCRHAFDPGSRPLASPSVLGRDLFARYLRHPLPLLTDTQQTFIRRHCGQGRMQLFPATVGGPVDVHVLDARFAYSAVLRSLPIADSWIGGEAAERHIRRCRSPRVDPHLAHRLFAPGFVLAAWAAPGAWSAPGILPERIGDRWEWPLLGSGWVSTVEYDLACRWGWKLAIHDAVLFTETTDVLDRWATKVATLGMSKPLTRAARAIILQTIGAMWGAGRREVIYSDDEMHGDGVISTTMLKSGQFRHVVEAGALWPTMHHPEWTGTVWARARARLLDAPAGDGTGRTGALHLRPGSVVGMRTDAVYTTDDDALAWADDGRAGRYRHQRTVTLPEWPTRWDELS